MEVSLEDVQAEIARRQSGLSLEDVQAEIQRREEAKSRPLMDTAMGVVELATAAGTGMLAEPLAGLGGIAQSINPLAEEGAGAEEIKAVKGLAFQPGERGKAVASDIAEAGKETLQDSQQASTDFLTGEGDFLPGVLGTLVDAGQSAAESLLQSPDAVAEEAGPLAGSVAKSIPAAIGAITGLQGGRAATRAVSQSNRAAQITPNDNITRLIKEGVPDKETARFHIPEGATRAVKDNQAIEVIKQGFDEGAVSVIKASSPVDRQKMKRMLQIQRRADQNARFATLNRPSDVVGDSMLSRVKSVLKANRDAGNQIDRVAKGLRGKRVDFAPAGNQFLDDLAEMGVGFDGNLKPTFKGSDIEGIAAAENAIKRLSARMSSGGVPDAFDIHKMKRFIDEQVTFGKNAEGLAGKTEAVMKRFRRSLDKALDDAFPEYNAVNTKFSETRDALDQIQDIAGRKMNFDGPNADKQLGTLLRRITSNAQSRVPLMNAADALETVAKRHGVAPKDDLVSQIMFVTEMERVLGPSAKTGLQGQLIQAGEQVVKSGGSSGSLTELGIEATKAAANAARGVNRENALKAVEALLSR